MKWIFVIPLQISCNIFLKAVAASSGFTIEKKNQRSSKRYLKKRFSFPQIWSHWFLTNWKNKLKAFSIEFTKYIATKGAI